jgi:hypothetical protein
MKTSPNQLPVRNLQENLALAVLMVILFVLSFFQNASAQAGDRFQNDPYFPARHRFSAGLITTYRGSSIPAPVAIGEITYGVNNRFSVGVVGGTIGTLGLVGVRLAGNFYQKNNFRLLGHISIIYYPERNGTFLFDSSSKHVMPWILSMGFLDAEWKLKGGIRLSAGMGLLETHCVDGMMDLFSGHTDSAEEKKKELPFELYNAVRTSVSIPLSKRFTLQPEAITVMKGARIVSAGERKVAPLYLYLHLVYTF